jgi:hypothetical protein
MFMTKLRAGTGFIYIASCVDTCNTTARICRAVTIGCWHLQVKLLRQADCSLELLDGDEAKYADEMTQQQEAFVSTINNLAAVSHQAAVLPVQHACMFVVSLCAAFACSLAPLSLPV